MKHNEHSNLSLDAANCQSCRGTVAPLDDSEMQEMADPEAEELEFEHGEEGHNMHQRAPMKPSPEEVESHLVSHLPFRSWCTSCVRGRGLSIRHGRIDHSTEQIATISVDYVFLAKEGERAADTPILVAKDRFTKFIWAIPVPSKGTEHVHGSNMLLEAVRESGYKRLILKSDQEPSIVSVCRAVKNAFEGEILLENAPKEGHEKSMVKQKMP